MKEMTMTMEETDCRPELHTVWVGEEDRIASFHEVEGYQLQTFTCHDYFINHLRALQERGFRFQ